jgi:hypothetical protein
LGLPYNNVSDPELLSLGEVLASIEKIAPEVADRIDVYQLDQLLNTIYRTSGGGVIGSDSPDLAPLHRAHADPGWVVPIGAVGGGDRPESGSLDQGGLKPAGLGKGSSGGGPVGGADDPFGGANSGGAMKGDLTRAYDTPDIGSTGTPSAGISKHAMKGSLTRVSDSPDIGSLGQSAAGLSKHAMADGPVSGSDSAGSAPASSYSNGISVDVVGSRGNRVSQILAADLGDESYWFQYDSNGIPAGEVTLLAVPVFDGSPLNGIKQDYQPNSNTSILSPFSIPFWAGNATSGVWVVIATNDQGFSAMTYFEVVP